MQEIFLVRQDDRKPLRMKSTAKQENKFNFKRSIYIPKMCVDPCPVGSTTLPPINKVFEKLLYDRLYSYLEHNKLLTDCQYGFRRGLSTELAINDLQNFLTQNIEKGLVTCSIFLDLAKAFDTVNHDILLHKLDIQYGIKGLPLSLLKNYLENHSHYVVINNSRSEMTKFTCGVPQGST